MATTGKRHQEPFVRSTRRAVPAKGSWCLFPVLLCLGASACAYEAPAPGDPAALADWRWLARPLAGERRIASDPTGKTALPKAPNPREGEPGFLALDAEGPGVLDHLWTSFQADARLAIEVDGRLLWRGPFGKRAPDGATPGLFPEPLLFEGGGMHHLVAPVGFQTRLRLIVDKPSLPHFASYRTFPKGTKVAAADPDANGAYARGLREVASLWNKHGFGLHESVAAPAREATRALVLPARGRAVALEQAGSGEVVALELRLDPALTGTLREVVVEVACDGAAPSLRVPITDLVGVPHPWPCGRWDRYNGDLAAGLRYPWYVHVPRYHFPEATFHFNLPIPFAAGLRIELANRSAHTQFVGGVRAVVEPLSAEEAARAGRLCGTRLRQAVRPAAHPQPLIRLPGPGQLAGLGLFMTGNSRWPRAVHESLVALAVDGGQPVAGPGLVPLWFQGIYGGPVLDRVIWNHPRLGEGYVGAMRHFLTDPIPFAQEAAFGYTPGPEAEGAPTEATVLAFWYRFSPEPYAAPSLPDQAEALPCSVFGDGPMRLGPGDAPARPAWATEAEALAPIATAHHTELRVAEDPDHNYHPSGGSYLHIVAERPGSYVDCPVRLPDSRYLSVGFYPLWGPGRGTFELDVLSQAEAERPPGFTQGDAFVRGRILGSPPMTAPIFSGDALDLRRDPDPHHTPPVLNPAPGRPGVLRLICQAKPMTSNSYLLKLDRLRIDAPPPTPAGWRECEELLVAEADGGLAARVAEHGRFAWSGWGALLLASPPGGKATLAGLAAIGPPRPASLRIKGCLGPDQGTWEARVAGCPESARLEPGKDTDEVVEWVVPAAGLRLPGPVALHLRCVGPGKTEGGGAREPTARLALDAWTLAGEPAK